MEIFIFIIVIVFAILSSKAKQERQKQKEQEREEKYSRFDPPDIFPTFEWEKPDEQQTSFNMEGEPVASHEGPCVTGEGQSDGHQNYGEGVSYNTEVFGNAPSGSLENKPSASWTPPPRPKEPKAPAMRPRTHVAVESNVSAYAAKADIQAEVEREIRKEAAKRTRQLENMARKRLFNSREDVVRAIVLGEALATPKSRMARR